MLLCCANTTVELVVPNPILPCLGHSITIPILDLQHPSVIRHLQHKRKVKKMLMVTINNAKNLPKGDLLRKSDPYVVIVPAGADSYHNRRLRTRYVSVIGWRILGFVFGGSVCRCHPNR